jgi:hypothetical protein
MMNSRLLKVYRANFRMTPGWMILKQVRQVLPVFWDERSDHEIHTSLISE